MSQSVFIPISENLRGYVDISPRSLLRFELSESGEKLEDKHAQGSCVKILVTSQKDLHFEIHLKLHKLIYLAT